MDQPSTSSLTDERSCIICEKLGPSSGTNVINLGEIVKISRGITTLRAASSKRQDGLLPHLQAEFVYAHSGCRGKYIHQKYIDTYKKEKTTAPSPPKKKLRSSIHLSHFNWENNCFICGQEANPIKEAKLNKNRRRIISYINIPTLSDDVRKFIAVQKDDYYREMHKRISDVIDLQALKAKYHKDCLKSLLKSVEQKDVENKINPLVLKIDAAMEEIFKYIEENEDCQFTMQQLKNTITTDHVPDEKTIRKRLIDRYHDDIILSCKFGSNTIICFKKMNHDILTENWYSQKCDNKKEEEFRILKSASEIIRRDIRSQVYDNENYSASDKMLQHIDESIPESLNFLLSEIIVSDKKRRIDTIPTYEKIKV